MRTQCSSFMLKLEKLTTFFYVNFSCKIGSPSPLVLDGVDLKLISVKVNGKELKEGAYILDSCHLTLSSPPGNKFTLEIDTEIQPQKNTLLEGLYKSSGNFCTQCE
ncbi:hypothetical protein J1N35_009972 [Gossypium stocksii]|uniref:Uncharacterized protein n=1 Tax=Gossypium stocksii TaxID=47602 RepID=A0A9D3VZI4_9ROSI|nr:hypothetical protein J1N35_009972 [Gossypium stocksii]